MADQTIQYTEEMVGAGHPTKADTLNRLALKYLNNDGSPIVANTSVSVNLSNNGTDSDHDIDLSAGSCFDDALTEPMVLSSVLTKQIDVAWAVGTNAGGLDTGTVAASTVYALWLIKRTDTGVVDALFSTSFTAPTMPTNYDKKRLIGFVVTDTSSNLIGFNQTGPYFRFHDPTLDINDSLITNTTFEPGGLSVPPNCLAHITVHLTNGTSANENDGKVWVRDGNSDDTASNNTAFALHGVNATSFRLMTGNGMVRTGASGTVEYAASETTGSATIQIRTHGCFMLTRSNP